MQKTTTVKKEDVKKDWVLIDAKGIRLGSLSSEAAKYLLGKYKAEYLPNVDCGDYVVVINSELIDVFPKKLKKKIYWKHSGYPGGLKSYTLEEMLKRSPSEVVKKSIKGMLPKNKLGRKIYKNLYVYDKENHKHEAQKPKLVKIN